MSTVKINRGYKNLIKALNETIIFLDKKELWWLGLLVVAITFIPWLILGEGSVFNIHDQLDETILSYIFNARHLGSDIEVFPEMMGGLNKSGMQPSAVLFVLLYRIFPPFTAFLIQYVVVVLCGYIGMYLLTKKVTESSILAVVVSMCFCMLPIQPIYGLSVLGVPLLIYAFMCLYDKSRIALAYVLILLFGLTTHLVLIGYVVLGVWACYLFYMIITSKKNKYIVFGFLFLIAVYIIVNHNLFIEVLLGQNDFISHREEFINKGTGFRSEVIQLFINSSQHAESLHKRLILPIVIMLILDGFIIRKKYMREKQIYITAVGIFIGLIGIAVFFGLCRTDTVIMWKNSMQGFWRYFTAERVYFLYPFLWYFEFALVVRIWWGEVKKLALIKIGVLIILLLPTLFLIKENSNFYMNINQINNGSYITGYISWESYYAEDLMQKLDKTIGRKKSSYRIAHLGISPAPSLMYGFYTVDGYSNNYSLEYKHEFRQIIAEELDKNDYIKGYFDTWGNRCYLFNNLIGNYYLISKDDKIQFENLEFDMGKLSELGCEYIFSGGEILDAKEMGLKFLGYYETEKSYWGIWLYQIEK